MWLAFVIPVLFLTLLAKILVRPVLNILGIKKSADAKSDDGIGLPPSPPKLPILGNLHQMGSVPPSSLRTLSREYGPLMYLHLGRIPTLVVTSPDLAREVFKAHDLNFSSRPPPSRLERLLFYGGTYSTLAPYGEHWGRARKLFVTHLLSPKMVRSFQRLREEEVASMIAKICRMSSSNPLGVVNVDEILSIFSADIIISRAVSDDFFGGEGRKRVLRQIMKELDSILRGYHLTNQFSATGLLSLFGLVARAKRVAKRMDDVLNEVFEHHARVLEDDKARDKPRDLVGVLLSLEKDGGYGNLPLARESMKTLLVDMFAAGTSTTYTVLVGCMRELLRNPRVMEKLQGEVRGIAGGDAVVREEDLSGLSFLKAVVKEVLRLHPPDPLLVPRETMEDCQLGGYLIPKRTQVFVNVWAISRDAKYWEEPEEFKPERFVGSSIEFRGDDFQFTPFGGGRRICPGMNFAVQTIELALANLVCRFDWEMPGDVTRKNLGVDDAPATAVAGNGKGTFELVAKPFSLQ